MRTRATAAAVLALAMWGAGAAASAAPETRLPDATLYCGDVVLGPDDWAVKTPSTIWIGAGPLAGHYVTLAYAHYRAPGQVTTRPESYEGLEPLDSKVFGTKQGLVAGSMTCDLVSRWDVAPAPFSIVGWVTLTRVSG